MPESLFNKIRNLYPASLLKENTPMQVLSDEFCEIFKAPVLKNSSSDCFCSTDKYFTSETVKNPLKKEKNKKTFGKKHNNTRTENNLNTTYH